MARFVSSLSESLGEIFFYQSFEGIKLRLFRRVNSYVYRSVSQLIEDDACRLEGSSNLSLSRFAGGTRVVPSRKSRDGKKD